MTEPSSAGCNSIRSRCAEVATVEGSIAFANACLKPLSAPMAATSEAVVWLIGSEAGAAKDWLAVTVTVRAMSSDRRSPPRAGAASRSAPFSPEAGSRPRSACREAPPRVTERRPADFASAASASPAGFPATRAVSSDGRRWRRLPDNSGRAWTEAATCMVMPPAVCAALVAICDEACCRAGGSDLSDRCALDAIVGASGPASAWARSTPADFMCMSSGPAIG